MWLAHQPGSPCVLAGPKVSIRGESILLRMLRSFVFGFRMFNGVTGTYCIDVDFRNTMDVITRKMSKL